MSQKDTAKYFGCSVDTVVRNLRDYHIESHKPNDWIKQNNIVSLSDHQREILYGALLGDGSLIKNKNGVNAQFSYTSKSKQHVEFVCNDFMMYSYKEKIKKVVVHDKRTNKDYVRYTFRTISDKGFTSEYKKWYTNKIKHIPKDLVLTPIMCLVWYIGDGGISNSSKSNSQTIKLSTNCFDKKEQEEILLPQLSQFNARLQKAGIGKNDKKQQYVICISKENMQDFLDYIGECPFEDYKYKWNVKKNKINSYKKYYTDWEMLYKSGVGYTKIAKKYKVDPTTVLKFLQKKGVYNNYIGYKQFYTEWENRYINGETYGEIAKDYDCCSQTILHHLRQAQIYNEKGVIQDGQ